MADFDAASRRLTANIVYFGPEAAGKTTNLQVLREHLRGGQDGEFVAFGLAGGASAAVGLLPVECRFDGTLQVVLKVWVVPGRRLDDLIRTMVLNRADAVVFVADSRLARADSNSQSFRLLAESFRRTGRSLDEIPLVVQYNKQDLDETLSEGAVLRHWEGSGVPVTFASAADGTGVLETLETLLVRLHVALDRQLGIESRCGIHRDLFLAGIVANGLR